MYDDVPIKHGDFPVRKRLNNQRVEFILLNFHVWNPKVRIEKNMFFWRWHSHKKLMLDIWDPMDPNSKTTTLHPPNQLKSYPKHFHIEYLDP